MKYLALMLLIAFPAFAHDGIRIEGPGELRWIPDAAPPVIEPEPPVDPPTEPPVVELPPANPGDWCSPEVVERERIDLCYEPDDSRTIYKAANEWWKPDKWHYFTKEGDFVENGPCISHRGLDGFMFQMSDGWRCQPYNHEGEAALHIRLKPGARYERCAHFVFKGSITLSAPEGTPEDQRPVLLPSKAINSSETGVASNGCIAGRYITDVTIRNVAMHHLEDKEGNPAPAKVGDNYYRCVQPGTGILNVNDSEFTYCKHGIQGAGIEWHIVNSKFLNCSYRKTGYNHCAYATGSLDKVVVTGSELRTCGGHALKSLSPETIVTDSDLSTGGYKVDENGVETNDADCDSGPVIHNSYGGEVTLENVTINKPADKGNYNVFATGDSDPERCKGTDGIRGLWKLTNVTVTAGPPRYPGNRAVQEITTGCPDLEQSSWDDDDGNTYNGEPMEFRDNYPFMD